MLICREEKPSAGQKGGRQEGRREHDVIRDGMSIRGS